MKVLHVTNNYPTLNFPIFGIFVKEQMESLSQLNIDCDVFFINGREKGKFEYLRSIIKLRKKLKSKKYDLVHCHHTLSAMVFILTGQSKKFKSIVSFQNDPSDESYNLFNLIKNRIDYWIFKNNSIYADGVKGFYLPNGVNTQFFKPINTNDAKIKIGLEVDRNYVLFVSSNYERKQKRYDRFCAVLDGLRGKGIEIYELRMINVKRELVPYYFNAASFHLLTSDFEGSPNSVKEAMACNIPVVSTTVGNVKDLLKDVSGCYLTGFEIKELVENCTKVLNGTKTDARDKLIQKKLDMESVAMRLKEIYTKALK
jgi:glycosyltransferase involved in cell wall biosynthesis